jgi:hypothetical protein
MLRRLAYSVRLLVAALLLAIVTIVLINAMGLDLVSLAE